MPRNSFVKSLCHSPIEIFEKSYNVTIHDKNFEMAFDIGANVVRRCCVVVVLLVKSEYLTTQSMAL